MRNNSSSPQAFSSALCARGEGLGSVVKCAVRLTEGRHGVLHTEAPVDLVDSSNMAWCIKQIQNSTVYTSHIFTHFDHTLFNFKDPNWLASP